MAVDVLAWAIKLGLGSASKWAAEAIFGDALSRKLNKTVEDWARGLPDDFWVDPQAIFNLDAAGDDLPRPRLTALQKVFITKRIPTEEQWLGALMERWEEVKGEQGADAQPFFKRSKAEVEPRLLELSRAIVDACRTDQDMFRVTVSTQIAEILSTVKKTLATEHRVGRAGDDRKDLHLPVIAALLKRENAKAEQLARAYLRECPESSRAHYGLAVALTRQGAAAKAVPVSRQMADARKHFETALENDILWVLRVAEAIPDPIDFVLRDPDLQYLFVAFPELRRIVELQRSALLPVMGTKSYGHAGCFAGETPIKMVSGEARPIQSVRTGDRVWSLNGNDAGSGTVVRTGQAKAFPIVLNDVIRVSPSQPLLRSNGQWATVREIAVGDEIMTDSLERLRIERRVVSQDAEVVFWLEVEPHHTYSAGGTVAHNKMLAPDDDLWRRGL